MRKLISFAATAAAAMLTAVPAFAQEAAKPAEDTNLLAPHAGLMFWTLVIFVVLFFILARYAYPPMLAAVEAREKTLEENLRSSQAAMAAAQKALDEAKAQLDASHAQGQKFIAESRATAEKMRETMLEETKKQQDELLARARRDIEGEKTKAIADLRSEAIDLALKGASRVIEKNLDDATNRKLVEDFLKTVGKS